MAFIKFSEICLDPVPEGHDLFRVCKPIEVRLNGGYLVVIEKNIISDGASIPKWARWKFNSWGKYAGPALLHDHLLKTTDKPKWLCDVLFYIALRSGGVSALESAIFWMCVRIKRTKD